jgi:hypothetical protein
MTIAACYVSREGVVLGADSTSTFEFGTPDQKKNHYFNYSQKLFEIGEKSTLGIVAWGLGAASSNVSYRTMTARVADTFAARPVASVLDVANRWIEMLWAEYQTSFANQIKRAQELIWKDASRTPDEDAELKKLEDFIAGFCIGGYWPDAKRTPCAYEIIFDPRTATPVPRPIPLYRASFWGVPQMMGRLTRGIDVDLLRDIYMSDHWTGTADELLAVLAPYNLHTPNLPIREAIDFIHASIYSTVKGLKFSRLDQVCGGPIEIAVITADRRFRWVRHKHMDAAIQEQEGDIWRKIGEP